MNTEKPRDMSEAEVAIWSRCIGAVLANEHEEHAKLYHRDRARTLSLLARAREIAAEARLVPHPPLGAGAIGRELISGLAFLAASVESCVHVAVDRQARPHFERILLEHEASHPDTSDIGWWHALGRHSFDLDDPEGICTCGARVGGFLTLAELHHRAREKYDVAKRMPQSSSERWGSTR